MFVKKVFYRWNAKFNSEKYNLDDYVSKAEIETNFDICERDSVWWTKKNSQFDILLDDKNKISRIFHIKPINIGSIELENVHQDECLEFLDSLLDRCDKNTKKDQLVLVFADWNLHVAIYNRKQ